MEKFLSVYGAETTYIAASAAIIAAIISGLVAIGGYILTSRNNTKLSFINTATASRIKWMSEVRELLSDFITFLPQYNPFVLGKIKNDEFDFTNDYFNLNKLIKIKTKLELLLGSKEKECNRESNEDDRDLKVLNSVKEAFDIVNKLNIFFTMYLCNSQNENENLATVLDENFCEKLLEKLDSSFFQGNDFKDNREKLIYFLSSKNGSNEEFLKHVYIVNINSSIKYIINKELNSKVEEIVKNSQEALKFEWERVKKESKKGDLKKRNKLMKPFKK